MNLFVGLTRQWVHVMPVFSTPFSVHGLEAVLNGVTELYTIKVSAEKTTNSTLSRNSCWSFKCDHMPSNPLLWWWETAELSVAFISGFFAWINSVPRWQMILHKNLTIFLAHFSTKKMKNEPLSVYPPNHLFARMRKRSAWLSQPGGINVTPMRH